MNTKQIKNNVILIFCILITQIITGFKPNKSKLFSNFEYGDSTIVGSWKSQGDNNWKFIFKTDSTCSSTYSGGETYNYTYKISNTSPQCGETVVIDNYTNYLQLTNISDSTDKICYLINGITSTNLSLSPIDRGGAFVFIKQ
nr:hypothetical protein [uncultured Pedobacter sp.]